MPDYAEMPVESAAELDELAQLRRAMSWTEWKEHPRFKKDRVLREAFRRWGATR